MGDLIATCASPQSRNRHVGVELGRGRALDDIVERDEHGRRRREDDRGGDRAGRGAHDVEMPLASFVGRVLYEGARPADLVPELMLRKAKPELHGMRDAGGSASTGLIGRSRRAGRRRAAPGRRPAGSRTRGRRGRLVGRRRRPLARPGRGDRRPAGSRRVAAPVVETTVRVPSGDVAQRVYGGGRRRRAVVVIEVENRSPVPLTVGVGGARRSARSVELDGAALRVDGEVAFVLSALAAARGPSATRLAATS